MKLAALSMFVLVLEAGAQTHGTIVDLTYPFSAETIYWPTAEGFRLKVDAAGVTDKGYYYGANSFCAAEHGGTHLDAPVHFARGAASVDRIPLERLIGAAIVVDVSARAARDRDYLVSTEDFAGWEKANGRIGDGTIVLLRTGWGRFYPDRKKYLGTDRRGAEAVAELHFPGLDPAAARWLVANRKIGSIGLDTASIDRGQSQTFESHQVLFKAGIPALENVAHLDRLPLRGFRVVALPMNIQGGTGAPLRIVALFDK
jgi:kynurenine formamidase